MNLPPKNPSYSMSDFIDDITFFLSSLFHSIAVTVSITIAVTVSILFALHFDTVDDDRKVLEFIPPGRVFPIPANNGDPTFRYGLHRP